MVPTSQIIRTLSFVPSDWFVKFDSDFQKLFKTKKSVRIVKLIENSRSITKFEKHIRTIKRKRESTPILFKPFMTLDSRFVRIWSYLIGDGCINRSKIRAYDRV